MISFNCLLAVISKQSIAQLESGKQEDQWISNNKNFCGKFKLLFNKKHGRMALKSMNSEIYRQPDLLVPSSRIVTFEEAVGKFGECREKGLRTVLCLGVFDVVHVGHLDYFNRAKASADLLFVGVENDETVRINKGEGRPFVTLAHRLKILGELRPIDYVFGYPDIVHYLDGQDSSDEYVRRLKTLNPSAMAVTSWDVNYDIKKLEAWKVGVEVLTINDLPVNSTTNLLRMMGLE
jgi:cytidyltransferase-like protein